MTAPRPLARGRILALLGILLCAFSLRSAVASLSPLLDYVAADFAVSAVVLGLIGTAPPVCFAIFGLCTPLLERRFGLERVTVLALTAIAAGLVLRGFAGGSLSLLFTTALIFAGVGMGNILVPPLVKKYFADRIGVMLTLYTTAMAVSTVLPPLVAVPVADAAGWRVSLGLWGVFALAGIVPWVLMLATGRTAGLPAGAAARGTEAADADPAVLSTGPIAVAPTSSRLFARLLRLPLAWSIAVVFSTSSIMAYVAFAWLPSMVSEIAGVSAVEAGLLLSLFAVMGLPASLLVPVLVVRFQATRPVYAVGSIAGLLGVLGLLLWSNPVTVWLWTGLFGIVGVMFPLALVLISIRSRTPESAVVLSSFVQSVGYVIAAGFPLVVGVLHEATGSWRVPLLVILGVLIVSIPFGFIAGSRRTVEEEWERRHGRW
ncbi:MFS transporter [uncultured Microbacterium sp.]|uniref:MFS transporter n=1 Tax=uncultured Microbacterium sp. TaxID=191216 RepID=UPI002639F0EB|nr:MFS transporter [uncultured Microbacterium sp.]